MIRLVKYCKPEHNLLHGCRTIRLGTFEYYRELDPNLKIADDMEGRDSVLVKSMKTETASLQARAEIGGIFPDRPYTHINNFNIRHTFPNCFLFCCSILSKRNRTKHAQRFDEQYTSHYMINNVVEFVQQLILILNFNIKIDHFSDPVRKQLKELSINEWGINVGCYYNQVRYVPEKHSQIEDGKMQSYIEEIPAGLRSIFVKPDKFVEDQEFRIVFLIQHPRLKVLSVSKEPVDLPILPVGEIPLELNIDKNT